MGEEAKGSEASLESRDGFDVSLTPTLTGLLKPSADYLGQELKAYLQTSIEGLKERIRSHNIREHLRESFEKLDVDESDQRNPTETVRQAELFEDWVSGAQDVDPTDKVLAEMWQELLRQIIQGRIQSNLLIAVLKQIDVYDANLLLNFTKKGFYRPKDLREGYHLNRLKTFEVVEETERGYMAIFLTIFGLFGALGYNLYEAAGAFAGDLNVATFMRSFANLLPQIGGGMLLWGIATYAVFRFVPKWRLTWIGTELLSHAHVSEDKES